MTWLYGTINPELCGTINPELCGNVSGLCGTINPDLRGDVSGLFGDVTRLTGNIDECGLTDKERAAGVDVRDLIGE